MDTATREWIEQVRQEHVRLEAMVKELREFLDLPRPDLGVVGAHSWAAELSTRLVKLHDEFFRHFRFEEEGGMIEELKQDHPESTADVRSVVAEHAEILRLVRNLMTASLAYSEGIEPSDSALRTNVTELLDSFAEHERTETRLLQRFEYRDFGVGD